MAIEVMPVIFYQGETMKNAYRTLFIITLFKSLIVIAGGESSGGGGAAVCRDNNKKIISAQLLDLYEGTVRFNYNIPRSSSPVKDQILGILSKIDDPMFKQLIKQTTVQVLESSVFLPSGVGMAPTTDLGAEYAVVVPEGCAIEPIGFYEFDGSLKLSRSVYQALSETDRAAFFIHESIYKIARDLAFKRESSASRKTVAALFTLNLELGNSELYQLFYNPTDFSLAYLNYHQIGLLNLPMVKNIVTLNINIDSSTGNSISVQCSSSYRTTYQAVENQSSANFKMDTKNCLSFNLNIISNYDETLAGKTFGNFAIKDSDGNLLSSGHLTYARHGIQKDLSTVYFIPIFHLYKEIQNTPQP
ncbi:MAG: hypothetical protein H7Z71_05155 [Moraxellaceae bacterium]|nr:hypothetical protein [Pseudobdellovibrionaceae bacterium]